jgi:hypothetical protein
MEHPSGEFADAVSAIESAIERLRALDAWDRWIGFSGQGQGGHSADLLVRGDEIQIGQASVDLERVFEVGGLDPGEIDVIVEEPGTLKVRGASATQFAKFLDGLFRGHLGVRDYEDDGDYAVGAEWDLERGS